MAITLNYEWQEFDRVTFYSSGSTYDTVAIEGRLTGQSTQYNYSTIELRWKNIGSWWRTSNGTVSFTGTYTDSGGCATYPDRIETGDVFYTIAKTVYHDNNGDATIYVGGTIRAYVGGANRTGTISNVTVYLPHINRLATITGAVDFNDEGNPLVTYNNPAGFRINARLEFSDTNINRENIANTGTYTFELTTAERNLLRQKCTGKTMTVRYVIATCYTGTTEEAWSTADRTMTIVNGNPTFSVTYQDTNSTTTAITNNNQQIIQNNSTLQFNIASATALKYASLSSVTVSINGVAQTKPISSSTLAFNYGVVNVANNINAIVTLTDSRGLTTTTQVPLTILSWNTPTAIITLNRKSNYYTETDITVDANYSSLDSKNTITIKYRTKKKTDSSYGAYSNLSDNVTATFNADNTFEWDVQVLVQDRLGSATYNLSLGVGVPIFFIDRRNRNVGVNCFPQSTNALEVQGQTQVNGDLIVADTNGDNPVNVLDLIAKKTSIAYLGNTGNQTINNTSTWAWHKVPFSRGYALGSYLECDTTNKRIVVKKKINYIKITAEYNYYSSNLSADRNITLYKNGSSIGMIAYGNATTTGSQNVYYTCITGCQIFAGPFNANDYFELYVNIAPTGTETLFSSTNYIIEVLD